LKEVLVSRPPRDLSWSRWMPSRPSHKSLKNLEIPDASVQSSVRTMRKPVKKVSPRTAAGSGSPVRVAPSRSNTHSSVTSILTINSGSSSIKFALYHAPSLDRIVSGKLERIGLPDSSITIKDKYGDSQKLRVKAPNHRAGGEFIIAWLEKKFRLRLCRRHRPPSRPRRAEIHQSSTPHPRSRSRAGPPQPLRSRAFALKP